MIDWLTDTEHLGTLHLINVMVILSGSAHCPFIIFSMHRVIDMIRGITMTMLDRCGR